MKPFSAARRTTKVFTAERKCCALHSIKITITPDSRRLLAVMPNIGTFPSELASHAATDPKRAGLPPGTCCSHRQFLFAVAQLRLQWVPFRGTKWEAMRSLYNCARGVAIMSLEACGLDPMLWGVAIETDCGEE